MCRQLKGGGMEINMRYVMICSQKRFAVSGARMMESGVEVVKYEYADFEEMMTSFTKFVAVYLNVLVIEATHKKVVCYHYGVGNIRFNSYLTDGMICAEAHVKGEYADE